jgi:hypothetical protein
METLTRTPDLIKLLKKELPMKKLPRKALLLLIPCGLVFLVSMASQPQLAQAAGFCTDRQGKLCFTEEQQIQCTYLGCCGFLGTGSCVCVDGHWDCGSSGVPVECPQPGDPDYVC